MSKQRGFTIFELLMVVFVVALFGGWIANIYKLVGLLDGAINAWLVARTVGIFVPPFGAVLGFL